MLEHLGNLRRTHYCGQLRLEHVGQQVTLMGWVDRRRDLGQLIFIDLRDREGIVQVVFKADYAPEAHRRAETLRSEYVVAVQGQVVARHKETINSNIATGEIEVVAEKLYVLNDALNPPFAIADSAKASEELRLEYRYLDLRSSRMQRNIKLRHRVYQTIRSYMDAHGFLEIETPFLTKSTPEGARDFLVPSRLYPGKFYALPQSPQLFKQILMIAGFDRYFQIVRCFRDEDLRADRQPEFTQVDIEMSFPQREAIFELIEGMMEQVFALVGVKVERPFPRLAYAEAISRYGSDKPDIRFGMEFVDVSKSFVDSEFEVFRRIIAQQGCVKAIVAPGCAKYSRGELDGLSELVKQQGGAGLVWIKLDGDGIKSSFPKSLGSGAIESVISPCRASTGDLILIVGGMPEVVSNALSALRSHIARQENLISSSQMRFVWITDFPLLEWSQEEGRYVAVHHPFTSPLDEDLDKLESDPGSVRAKAYDLVLNGIELGGGSIRIHRSDIQRMVFKALGISEKEAEEKFGFLLKALQYGAPPHGGIALGLDRIVMLLAGEKNIREVIAFPKTASGTDLMAGSPSPVSQAQLKELKIKIIDE